MSKPAWNDLTPEQRDRLREFAIKHGHRWKEELNWAWSTGKDAALPGGFLLRQIRNTRGPRWLSGLPTAVPKE